MDVQHYIIINDKVMMKWYYLNMSDYDREPYQELVDKTECAFCGEVLTEYKFCSDDCAKAYWND